MKLVSPSVCFIFMPTYNRLEMDPPSSHFISDLQCAIYLALLHQVPPRDSVLAIVGAVDELRQVQFNVSQYDPLSSSPRGVFLQHFEMYLRLLQYIVTVNGQPYRQDLLVFPYHLVLSDCGLGSSAAMLGGGGGWEMPFDVASPRDQGHVVQIDDLSDIQLLNTSGQPKTDLELQIEPRLKRGQQALYLAMIRQQIPVCSLRLLR